MLEPGSVVQASPQKSSGAADPLPTLADVLEEIGDLSVPGNREKVVARMKEIDRQKRITAVAEAQQRGLPVRIERPDGTVQLTMTV